MNTYSVVKFTEDNSLEAVPTNWLKKNKCAWSITKNYSTIRKLIERKIIPNEIKYTYFNARLLKTTDSLLKAREMTKKGLTRTDISSYIRQRLSSEDDDDSGTFSHKTKVKNTPGITHISGWSPSPKKNIIISCNIDYGFQKDVLHKLAFIKHELRRVVNNQLELSQRFEYLESKCKDITHYSNSIDNMSSLNYMSDCTLPMDNTIDLQTLNDKISGDSAFRINLTNQLSYIGGKHSKSMIKRIMSKLFTDELLKLYSYSGKKGKDKFSSLAVCSVIFDAVKQNHKFKNVTQNDMEKVVKYVLAQAAFNIKRLE
ncbi:uncharacterized protein LOC112681288, partial [Sipha flava]|uniref:Uncharacterized protein LOC112681288 n=1 Tax=Sipha flava TaxID=143950 RepID=A0A8B8FAB3_9HEMI